MFDSPPAHRLRALQNARDLGGLAAAGGSRVRHGVLYRSDAPQPGDVPPPIQPWPPRLVLDLRSVDEATDAVHPLAGPGTDVLPLPLLARASPPEMAAAARRRTVTLHEVYGGVLRTASPVLARIAGLVAEADGPVLVHCAAGKDRTGVTVATLLSAVGVEREEIVRDYVRTEANIDGIIARMATAAAEIDRDAVRELVADHRQLMQAPAEAIEAVLDMLDEHPGGAAGLLRAQGTSEAQLIRLRARLLGA